MHDSLFVGPGSRVDLRHLAVHHPDRSVDLTAMEARLLAYLGRHGDRAVPRRELLTEVWGYHPSVRSRTVDNTVRRLRVKLEADPKNPTVLVTEVGVGYRLVVTRDEADSDLSLWLDAADRAEAPLCTVVGAAGVGKSRAARAWADSVGARVLDLREVTGAERLGVLARHPDARWLLDHADGCGGPVFDELRSLLRGQVVATSRAPLGVEGERVWQVQLLDEAGAAALWDEVLGRPTAPSEQAALYRVVGGLPLAIRMAAPVVRAFGVGDVVARIEGGGESLVARGFDHPSAFEAVGVTLGALSEVQRRSVTALAGFDTVVPLDEADAALGAVGRGGLVACQAAGLLRHDDDGVALLPLARRAARTRYPDEVGRGAVRTARKWVAETPFDTEQLCFVGSEEEVVALGRRLPRAVGLLRWLPEPLGRALGLRLAELALRCRPALLEPLLEVAPLDPEARAIYAEHGRRLRGEFIVQADVGSPRARVARAVLHYDRREIDEGLALLDVPTSMVELGGMAAFLRARLLHLRGASSPDLARAAAERLWHVPLHRGRAAALWARHLIDAGRFVKAEELLDAAEGHARAASMDRVRLDVWTLRGHAASLQHRHQAAAEANERAAGIAAALGEVQSEAACYANAGAARHALGELSAAVTTLQRAAQREPAQMPTHLARALLAAVHYERGERALGDALMDDVTDVLTRAGDPGALLRLARLHRAQRVEAIDDVPGSLARDAYLRRFAEEHPSVAVEGQGEARAQWALTILWCRDEPQRVGETFLLLGPVAVLGRGAPRDDEPRVSPWRIRPGVSTRQPPLGSEAVARRQLRLTAGPRLQIDQLGTQVLRFDGVERVSALVDEGTLLEVEGALVLHVRRRPGLLVGPIGDALPFGAPDARGLVGESPEAWSARGSSDGAEGPLRTVSIDDLGLWVRARMSGRAFASPDGCRAVFEAVHAARSDAQGDQT